MGVLLHSPRTALLLRCEDAAVLSLVFLKAPLSRAGQHKV